MASSLSAEEKALLEACKTLHIDSKEELEELVKSKSGAPHVATLPVGPVVTSTISTPKISIFFGDTEKLTKGECLYDQWRFEVRSLLLEGHYKPEVIVQAIRRSVKGDASRVLMRLSPKAGIEDILNKFDSVYGITESKETLMAEFYSARQADEESITEWSCRLEDIMNRAVEKNLVKESEINGMLCSMFWSGMKQELKDLTAFKFEAIKDFDQLRTEIRKMEKDRQKVKREGRQTTLKSTVYKEERSKTEMDLKGLIENLNQKMSNMEERLDSITVNRMQANQPDRNDCGYGQDGIGNSRGYNGNRINGRGAQGRGNSYSSRSRGGDSNWHFNRGGLGRGRASYHPRGRGDNWSGQGPLCYRCRERGHLQWECNANLDTPTLNPRAPVSRDRQQVTQGRVPRQN